MDSEALRTVRAIGLRLRFSSIATGASSDVPSVQPSGTTPRRSRSSDTPCHTKAQLADDPIGATSMDKILV
jgi:hypothetical protein